MKLSRMLTTLACAVCVPAFLLAGPQSSRTQSDQSTTSSQSPRAYGTNGTSPGGARAMQNCNEAQTSLDKAWSMYNQLQASLGTSSGLGASASSSTQPGNAAQSRTSDGTSGAATWDNFRTQLEHARTHLSYCLSAMSQMHGSMMHGSSSSSSQDGVYGSRDNDKEKDKNKP